MGPWGSWNSHKYCDEGNFVTGAKFRSEEDVFIDDTAGNDLNLECGDGTELHGESSTNWGDWSSMVSCYYGSAICGFKTKVEKAGQSDDTALNAVSFYCCHL